MSEMENVSPEAAEITRTDILKKSFLKQFKVTLGNVSHTAESVNINRVTYYRWRDSDAEFKEAADDIIASVGDFVESKLLKAINEDNITGIIFFCKTKLKDRGYVERVEATGKDGGPIDVTGAEAILMRGLVPELTSGGETKEN